MTKMEYEVLPLDLLQVVRQSLKASQREGILNAETFDPRSPALRKLVEQLLFSRRFILTYYGVLGVLVVAFAVNHWYEKRKRWTKRRLPRRKDNSGTPTSNASSDTTLLPSEAQSVKDDDTEQTPLLHSHAALQKFGSSPPTVVRHLRGFLMHQPSPMPALTAPKNHLPSNSTTLVVLLLLAVNLFYLFYHMPFTIPMLFAFADRASLCFVINLPVLYVLAAKTNQPLQFLTGWSYEGLNLFHRRLGEWMIAFAALHGVGMIGVWYTLLRPLHFGLVRFLTSRVILLGMFTLFAYLGLYITSIGWIRRLYYETFLGLHIVLQVAALALVFFHHHGSQPYVLASLAVWVLDRVLARLILSPRKLVVTLQVAPDQRTVLLFCDVPISGPRLGVKLNICHGWQPGQHVFVTVPGLGWRHKLQAHPFTIASPAPPSTMQEGSWPLQLTIRAQDGFSLDLLEFAKFHQHTEVFLDGPHGSLDALEAARSADRVCFVAGGSGIAVTYPLCWAVHVSDDKDVMTSARTLYSKGVRCGPGRLTYEELGTTERGAHLWVRQDAQSDSWISYFPRRRGMVDQTAFNTDEADERETESVVQLITSKFETGGMHDLRPDIATELREWVERGALKRQSVVVVVSGPDGLVRDVRNAAASLTLAGYDIEVHVEKFGW